MSKKTTWRVNDYNAAICVSTAEINRNLKIAYGKERLPTHWEVEDDYVDPVTFDPDPVWKFSAELDCPKIDFASDFEIRLLTPLKSGTLTVKRHSGNSTVPLDGALFSINTDIDKVTHQGEHLDKQFTTEALYMDLENPDLFTKIGSSYSLNENSLYYLPTQSALTADKKKYKKIITALKTSTIYQNNFYYTTRDDFWSALEHSLSKDDMALITPFKNAVIKSANSGFSIPDNHVGEIISSVMTQKYQSSDYKEDYIIGTSTIPEVEETKGPFTPRAIGYSTFPNKKDQKNTAVGSINWNIMVSEKTQNISIPTGGKAGVFDSDPIPQGKSGVLLISYEKLIRELIFANLSSDGIFSKDKWSTPDEGSDRVDLSLNQDLDLDCSNMKNFKSATFKKGDSKMWVDLDSNKIKVDFKLSDIEGTSHWYDNLALAGMGPIIGFFKKKRKFHATWTGNYTFKISDDKKHLKVGYELDKDADGNDKVVLEENKVSTGQKIVRVISDIGTLALNELGRHMETMHIDKEILGTVKAESKKMMTNLIDSVDLTGKGAFTFDEVSLVESGLQVTLKYEDKVAS